MWEGTKGHLEYNDPLRLCILVMPAELHNSLYLKERSLGGLMPYVGILTFEFTHRSRSCLWLDLHA